MRLKSEMWCPTCDCKCDSVVIDTTCSKLTSGEVIKRRRACNKCGAKFTTYEIHADEYKNLLAQRNKAREISNAIKNVMNLAEKYKGGEERDGRSIK